MDVNATIPYVQPLSTIMGDLVSIVTYLVGGFIGVYIISVSFQIYLGRKNLKRLKNIENRLSAIEEKLNKLSLAKGRSK